MDGIAVCASSMVRRQPLHATVAVPQPRALPRLAVLNRDRLRQHVPLRQGGRHVGRREYNFVHDAQEGKDADDEEHCGDEARGGAALLERNQRNGDHACHGEKSHVVRQLYATEREQTRLTSAAQSTHVKGNSLTATALRLDHD
jgi:hypothetical protein